MALCSSLTMVIPYDEGCAASLPFFCAPLALPLLPGPLLVGEIAGPSMLMVDMAPETTGATIAIVLQTSEEPKKRRRKDDEKTAKK